MTEGNVAVVRRVYQAFNAGDTETLVSLAAPEFVIHASEATDGAEHHGPGAFAEIQRAIDNRWRDLRLEPLEFYEAGDKVLVLGTLVAKSRENEGLASITGHVWTLREGKLTAMKAYLSSEEAIREAGLTRLLT